MLSALPCMTQGVPPYRLMRLVKAWMLCDRGLVRLGKGCSCVPTAGSLLEVVQLKEDFRSSLAHIIVQVAISRFSQRHKGVIGEQELPLAFGAVLCHGARTTG